MGVLYGQTVRLKQEICKKVLAQRVALLSPVVSELEPAPTQAASRYVLDRPMAPSVFRHGHKVFASNI